MIRRLGCGYNLQRLCSHIKSPQRCASTLSMKEAVLKYGIPVALYYWITNEIIVCILTYFLHYGYFGKDDLIGILDRLGASKFINLRSIEGKTWSVGGDGGLVISARFLANFTAASVFMSLFTPLQIPICIATYPYMVRTSSKLFRWRKYPPV